MRWKEETDGCIDESQRIQSLGHGPATIYDTAGQITWHHQMTWTFPKLTTSGRDTRTPSECSVALFSQLFCVVLPRPPYHSYSALSSLQVTLLGSRRPSHSSTWPPPLFRYFVRHWAKNSSCKPSCITVCLR
jgi:hypothetical protein